MGILHYAFPNSCRVVLYETMVWLPDWKWKQQKKGGGKGSQMVMVPMSMLMGGGWGGGKRGKKGGGKGFRKKSDIGNRTSADKKLWIGGLPVIEDREKCKEASKKLHEHMKKYGDCKFAEIWPKGVGVAVYKTEEDAQSAIAEANGIKFRGKALEIDSWE